MQFLFTLIEVVLIILGTLYLFRQYPNKQVHLAVKAICFTSWFISFVILILVPLDLIYTLGDHADTAVNGATAHASYKAMTIVWEVVYWTSFIFTWLVLPLLQEYVDAGDFSRLDRLKRSIKVNVAIYAAMGLFGVIFIFYLKVSGRVEEEGIPHFLITFSNCFGIVLIILCLSYGLVFIPKRCFQQTRQRFNLKIHQFQMAVIDGERNNIIFRFEGLIKTIVQILNREDVSEDDKAMLKEILVIAPIGFVEEVEEMTRNSGYPAGQSVEKVTKTKIASLHKKMKKKVNEMRRIEMRWQVTLRKASFLEDVINARNPTEWRTKRSYTPYQLRNYEKSLSVIQWLWHAYLSRVAAFLVGLVCIAASAVVFFAEIMNFDDLHIFDIETYIRRGSGTVSKSQFLCLIPLFYISICVYSALFNMRLAGRYGLYRHHQTDAGSLVFASLNFSRVSSPLVFNFLQMLQINNTAFHSVMGNVQFAYSFMTYFPVLLIVLILCNVFDIYARVLDSFGLKRFKFNEESTIEKIEEGKKLLLKARVRERSDSGNTFNGRSGQKQEVEDAGSTKEPSPIKGGYMLQNTELVGPVGRSLQDI